MGIGHVERLVGVALALMAFIAPASAQITLPEIDVSWTRLNSGMVGTSNSVITSQDIERSPAQNLPDILSREVGIQIQHLLSSTNGSRDGVDLRGFGAFAQSNVLILVNGRRYEDFDLQGFDFSSIPINSIERIEITRGNSSTVLYGDGAIGGSINIILKKGSSTAAVNRVDGLAGSFNYWEGRASTAVTSGPWSIGAFGNAIDSNGYRVNSALRRLQLDYVDLVFCHRPDPNTPIEETVRAMDQVVRSGKAFYWGTSEWSAAEIMRADGLARHLAPDDHPERHHHWGIERGRGGRHAGEAGGAVRRPRPLD